MHRRRSQYKNRIGQTLIMPVTLFVYIISENVSENDQEHWPNRHE
jgi:hypothetical protein